MNFGLTDEQESMVSHVKDLLDKVCPADYVARCDETERLPPAARGCGAP